MENQNKNTKTKIKLKTKIEYYKLKQSIDKINFLFKLLENKNDYQTNGSILMELDNVGIDLKYVIKKLDDKLFEDYLNE